MNRTTIHTRHFCRPYSLFLALCLAALASAQSKIYYVSPAGSGDGSSWDNATTLESALTTAGAGDQIWVQGSESGTIYTAPADGFALKSGVQLYGGFAGTELSIDDRETLGKPYQLKYRSVLSGDIGTNDVIDNTNLIFPANNTRKDNATHVLSIDMTPTSGSGNNNNYPTVVNGFSIGGGHADDADGKGGGIYIYGNNDGGGIFRIERCFFVNNYAMQGGAIYVADKVQNQNNNISLINQCVIYNNAAGERSAVVNAGGGIYLAGAATVVNSSIFNNENGGLRLSAASKVVNSTVARNTGAGIDMIAAATGFNVFNTIVWGNTSLSAQYQPRFKNSAYHEVASDDADSNVYVAKENRGEATAPMFDAPSVKTSFDRDFDWSQTAYPLWSWNVLEGSVMIDKGADDYYQTATYGSEDMAGNPRQDGTIDIGAYEYQKMPASRIRYVMETAQGTGDGSSWDNASGNIQDMIDELATNNPQDLAGEVWVAKGTYEPQSQLISGAGYSASFRMRDGISVYGGFAGTETSKQERTMKTDGMPWDFTSETILKGAYYNHDEDLEWNNNKWTLTSDSRHVVWFAPMSGEAAFSRVTTLDGVTIQGGYAQGGTGLDDFMTDRGGGVYMDGANAYLTNCIVKENYATGNGGGVYLKDGRVETSLVYNNNADGDGGAVYVDNMGLVLRSMLANNSAHNGAGVYLHNEKEATNDYPEYLILSTCVVSNNTMTGNGAVYCDKGGVLMQNTITNNSCVTATDATDVNASQTGGIYVDEYALVLNSVIWNNRKGTTNVPMYARNPSATTVRFLYNAISGVNNAIWNNTLQEQTLSLVDNNAGVTDDGSSIGPRFTEPADLNISNFDLETNYGVQSGWKDGIISYYWKPISGSNLWARGMPLGQLPEEVVLAPEVDIEGSLFAQKPVVGAFMVEAPTIVPSFEKNGSNYKLVLYIDAECTEPEHEGASWKTAFRSLNNAIAYCAALSSGNVEGHYEDNPNTSIPLTNIDFFEIRVLEGDLWPRYAFTNNDPKTATITVPAMASGKTIYIYGGYHRDETDATNNTAVRDPLTYRSVINGNTEGKDITQGLYHCITVQQGAKLVLDGFHVINGYAAGEASRQYGAGLLAHAGSEVTVRNCIFENNTAQEGAAIDAREATLTMQNCVVNNNTNTNADTGKPVVNAQTLTMEHVTVVNNVGAAYTLNAKLTSSFSTANSSQNTHDIEVSTAQFTNPTKNPGATLGFDTYYGGYSSFQPTNQNPVVNVGEKIAGMDQDITLGTRSRGGAPDLGAYEADLPVDGTVIYVRTTGDDSNDGLSWNRAKKTISAALGVTTASTEEIWVSAGTYTENINMKEGVDVLGGFAATGSPTNKIDGVNRDISHKIENFKTIIQGAEEHKFKPAQTNVDELNEKNKRVLTQPQNFTTKTLWEGFIITGGQTGLAEYGAGVKLMKNGHLKNCRIEDNKFYECGTVVYQEYNWGWQTRRTYCTHNNSNHTGGGGIYCAGGIVENCQIIKNVLDGYKFDYGIAWNERFITTGDGIYGKGAGLSISGGNIINCVIAQNVAGYDPDLYNNPTNYLTNILGSAVFVQSQSNFYSSTIVENTGGWYAKDRPIIPGVWDESLASGDGSYFYNCIIIGNYGYGSTKENFMQIGKGLSEVPKNLMYSYFSLVKFSDGSQTPANSALNADRNNKYADFGSGYQPGNIDKYKSAYATLNLLTEDFELNIQNGTHPCLNTGSEEYLYDESKNIHITQDANGYSRIQDCTVDIGAYELDNKENIKYTYSNGVGTYYVSQNGAGLRSGENPANAACAMKLQDILNAARAAVEAGTLTSAIVKVAGYENASFVYYANTLASVSDPQSYTYIIPEGVTLMGGYYEGTFNNGVYQDDGWDNATGDNVRNPMKFQTVLSAVSEANASTTQTVRGYHAVTFGAWPGTAALTKTTIIDGLYLIDGSATSMAGAGNPRTRGGGAIVPSGAHVRNCVVMNCEAIEGGGLYLLPGATVSGTAVIECEATNGAGIYAANTDVNNTSVTASTRAHILSCTIANNEASSTGGGLYMEEGAVMSVNTVVFDNQAGSDKNVSGVVSQQFADNKLATVFNISGQTSFYPFNNCFVETQEMPSDFENRMLESDKSLYFADDYYRLKDYSFLIKHGVKNEYQTELVATFNVATQDMQNINRIQTNNGAERLDAGAFAYEGGILPTNLFTRIFVSPTTNVTLPAGEEMNDYLGRSFYTSFSTLEDALGYIRSMRSGDSPKATDATLFEILVAGGTYKPSYLRTTGAAVDHDQKLYSFVVPQGVSIYGGFAGTENYSSGGITSIPTTSGNVSVDNTTSLTTILNARAYSDFNQNNILEPWELANQTILSGQINASSTAQNAYHVVFTEKGTATTVNPVVLDGLTVMYGQTDNELSYITNEDEQGRGGGIYSSGVTYTISRCRLLNNTAVRGGAVFVRNADLNLSGCILAGNKTVANTAQGTNTLTSRGGAAYVSGIDEVVNLRAVNTLWANNESADEGGAIGTNYADGVTSASAPYLYIMNNTFVRNKATTNPVIYAHNGKSHIVNTLIWGNEGDTYQNSTNLSQVYDVSHCASDVDYVGKFASRNTDSNILLSADNMGDKGPRFTNPSTVAGADGNLASNLWNPVAISVLTDAGDGTEHTANKNPNESDSDHKSAGTISGAYQDWFTTTNIPEVYITKGKDTYSRYSGPYGEGGKELCKPIDIGLYEYQYFSNFSTMPAIYVNTISQGDGSGNSWANATDDLRGAIVGAANPTDKKEERVVYVRDGDYSWSRLSAGSAYALNMMQSDDNISLTLKGSCTGSGVLQDFSKQTVLRNDGSTTNLMSVSTNSKPVTIEGFTFINDTENTGISMNASTGTNGSLTLKNCGFRISNTGLNIAGNSGKVLIYNTLFADGGTGLSGADSRTTVVNATFANNTTDYTFTETPAIYNSVSWNNDTQYLTTDDTKKNVNLGSVTNDDLEKGPNFKDPENTNIYQRDYSLRPSVTLLNKGSNDHYIDYALGLTADDAVIPTDEKALGNNARLVDNAIDVGAYEYEAPLQPIVYVKPDLTGTADGKSWETALGDLQGAVDLAGLYAKTKGLPSYVFVHGNYHDTGLLNLTLGNTKVYGSMNDERSTETETEAIVSDLLSKRKGMLEATERSSLEKVTIGADGVIDGFEVTGTATINNGVLATSIVKNDVTKGKENGLLYNSLVEGSVNTVQAVNVTATGTIENVDGSGNNRQNVTDGTGGTEDQRNTYVTDNYWNYQLMETSADIDPDPDVDPRTDISDYMKKVGHERDLIGNKRIRNIVDNGCFETWNISEDMTTDSDNDGNVDAYPITATDYPVGKSVVYVRKGQELSINDGVYPNGNAFNPGFLLLEHQAGLRGNGNFISLTNFAVERNIPAGGADLIAMPFDVNSTTSNLAGIIPQRYDGSIRARYDYKYEINNNAWTTQNLDQAGLCEGLLFENIADNDQTLRFYSKSTAPYTEDGTDKSISLTKYNFNEAWTTDADGNIVPSTSNRFTHKENMSWNLFGSPYLCAMNYSDLEYGRVLYGYNNGYQTVQTYNSDGTTVNGYIPAGNAVFTQSATLKDTETFSIAQPKGSKNGNPFQKSLNMAIYVDYTKTTASKATADYCSFNAVPASEASNDFDLGSDGVKWLADNGKPQIYAIRNGGRYSLLSAVNEEAETEIGLLLPEAGNYVIGIGEGSERQEYEAVILIDRQNNTTTDLLDKDYTFSASEGGTVDDRFRITFNPEANSGLHGEPVVRVYPEGKVLVSGITDGEYVAAYNATGTLVQQLPVTDNHVWFNLRQGFYLFYIHYADDTDKALKAIVP